MDVVVHIDVLPDYGCHPLWVSASGGLRVNTDPAGLPIHPALADDLSAWGAAFDATLNEDYPPASGFADADAENVFWAAGLLLAHRLAIEVIGHARVTYHDGRLAARSAAAHAVPLRTQRRC